MNSNNVAILTTSTSSVDMFPQIDDLPVAIVRFRMQFAGDTIVDGVNVRADTLLQRLYTEKAPAPTTSPPPEEEILAALSGFKSKGHTDILVLTISKSLSKFNEIVKDLSKRIEGVNIVVHDTETFGLPEGLMAYKAAQMAKQGASIDQIVKVMDRMKYDIEMFICLNSMNYLYGHDYVGLNKLLATKLLQIKPIVSFKQNEFQVIDKVRHFDNAIERMAEMVSEKIKNPNLQPIGLMMGNVEAYTKFIRLLPEQPKLEYPLSPICAAHIGIDGVAIAFSGKMDKYG